MTTPTPIVNAGYWKSWLVAVNELTAAMGIASPIQNAMMPADITVPSSSVRARLPAVWLRLMILMGITGSTHGVKFSSRPPIAATNSSSAKPTALPAFSSKRMPNRSNFTYSTPEAI